MTPAADERDRIRAAMDRILSSTPEVSNGALTIVALALEAGVPRNAPTQRHVDLKGSFTRKSEIEVASPTAKSDSADRPPSLRDYGLKKAKS